MTITEGRDAPVVGAPMHGEADVAIVGLGYVGLPTGLALWRAGLRVLGIDIAPQRLEAIRRAEVDLLDCDRASLGEALARGPGFQLSGRLEDLARAETVLVCVPTPVDRRMQPDLSSLRAACDTVVRRARPGQLIVLTSTSYPGTTRDLLIEPLRDRGLEPGLDVSVAFAPERIDPGNDRFSHENVPRVIGGATPACTDRTARFLRSANVSVHPVGSPEVAELTKLYENAFRAVNISLANELADVCRALGMDACEVIDAAATKPYGFMPFYPGPGVGGHCIPVDPHYLLWHLRGEKLAAPLIEEAMRSIAARPRTMVQHAVEHLASLGKSVRDSKVLVVGVTYKPGVGDIRGSSALDLMALLEARGAEVSFHDPHAGAIHLTDELILVGAPEVEPDAFDLVILHTAHPGLDLSWIGRPHVLDCTFRQRRS